MISRRFPLETFHTSRPGRTTGLPAASLKATLANACRAAREHLRLIAQEASACRACGRPAKLLSNICEHCGAGNPIKVNISFSVFVTAVGCELALVLLQVI